MNTAENQGLLTLILNPVPNRSQADAIVVEYEVNTDITTGTTDMPFPKQFDRAFVLLSAGYTLAEMDDETSQRKAQVFDSLGREYLFKAGTLGTIAKTYDYGSRIMP